MSPLRLWIVSILIILSLLMAVHAESDGNNAMPIGPGPQEFPDGIPPEYPTDVPTEYPTITIEPTIGNDYGWVSINTIPSGAWVTFDGSDQGTSPAMIQVMSTASPFHQIYISMDGYQDWSTSLSENPGSGQTIPVNAHLVPIEPTVTQTITPTFTPTYTPTYTQTPTPTVTPTIIGSDYGWVSLYSNPSGAEVTFDGIFQGSTPAYVKVFTTGNPNHQILIRMAGYYDWTYALSKNPAPDQTIPITADLTPMAQYGSIRVTSDPPKAIAIVDGGNQDMTPCTFYDLMPGSHTIRVNKEGYQQYSTQVQVYTGSQSKVSAGLSPVVNTGTLYVASTPSGADITLDGVYYGQTPHSLSTFSGSHSLVLKLAGYSTWKSGVTINAGQQNQITGALEPDGPMYGAIQVASIPGSSSVFLNDDYYGTTPNTGYFDIPELIPGTYSIRINHPQNQDYQGTVAVTKGQTSTVNVALLEAPSPATVNGTLIVNSEPSGVAVFLENLFKGVTPCTLPMVSPGEHTLMLRMNGYTDVARQITITGGNTTDIVIDMTPDNPLTQEPTVAPTQTLPQEPLYPVFSPLVMGLIGIIIAIVVIAGGYLYWRKSRV